MAIDRVQASVAASLSPATALITPRCSIASHPSAASSSDTHRLLTW
jgi:hypothetical protein